MSEPLDPKREAELRSLARSFQWSLFTDAVAEIDRLRAELADSKLPTLGDLKGILKVQADLDTARAQLALAVERESQIVLERDRLRDELRQLREAVEPIAQIEIIPGAPGDGALVGLGYSWMELEPMPRVSDLRKLAALLPAKGADHADRTAAAKEGT